MKVLYPTTPTFLFTEARPFVAVFVGANAREICFTKRMITEGILQEDDYSLIFVKKRPIRRDLETLIQEEVIRLENSCI